jgi:hypothetical protein
MLNSVRKTEAVLTIVSRWDTISIYSSSIEPRLECGKGVSYEDTERKRIPNRKNQCKGLERRHTWHI